MSEGAGAVDRGTAASRLRILATGTVQGVGFRPFVYRLATELGLAGGVKNAPEGVIVEVEGSLQALERFLAGLESDRPPAVDRITLETSWLEPSGAQGFTIWTSEDGRAPTTLLLPDLATCSACRAEIFDPRDRRHRYPFNNCTHCGPRFSIILGIPYDRVRTTMRRFQMCSACRAEYEDPADRRFHAQPVACPDCGPQLELWAPDGTVQARRDEALLAAADAIRAGRIVAVKGLGGFHLLVDARDDLALGRLRKAKAREEKPFALMAPHAAWVRGACRVSRDEERCLLSPQAPIVLLERRGGPEAVAAAVAPGNPYLGVMLPYTPLHHLLLAELDAPVVATSGNRADEPICTDEHEAVDRLKGIADLFLVHDRPIARPIDDGLVRIVDGEVLILRRARGYAPLPVTLGTPAASVLAVGAHLKSTVALALGREVFLSQHIGDLETLEAEAAHRQACADLPRLYAHVPEVIACDLHPDYASTRLAAELGRPVIAVQHHHAHVAACMAEHGLGGRVLGVAWDGTGYGTDGTVWGGEFLHADAASFDRVAHLRTFRLPGGEAALREPRRAALGLLHAALGRPALDDTRLAPVRAFTDAERLVLAAMLERGIHAPVTSSAGRLFDAVASLVGSRQVSRYEGQAALELESSLSGVQTEASYPFALSSAAAGAAAVIDWGPLVDALLADVRAGRTVPFLSARFHNTLVEMIVAVARRVGEEKVVLTGGCFQNRYLTERALSGLRKAGFLPYRHRLVPPNDGGIALGQAVVASARLLGGR